MTDSTNDHEHEVRPWGSFHVLDEGENFKVKRIEVLPGKRLSYQRHTRRSEHWFVTCGTAKVTLNDHEILVKTGQSVDISVGDKHRVENPGEETASASASKETNVTTSSTALSAAVDFIRINSEQVRSDHVSPLLVSSSPLLPRLLSVSHPQVPAPSAAALFPLESEP